MNFTNTDRVWFNDNKAWLLKWVIHGQVYNQAKWLSQITKVRNQIKPMRNTIKQEIRK